MSRTYPEVKQSRCARYRFRYSECRRCLDACPHEAIALSDEGASLDTARCQNCGLCSSACRTGAWQASNLSRVDLLKQAMHAKQWSFGCAPSGVTADAIVPCLGGIDAATLGYLGKRGISLELRGADHCSECAHAPKGRAQVDANIEAAALLREALNDGWASTCLVTGSAREDKPAEFTPARRQLFRRLFGSSANRAATGGALLADADPVPDRAIRAARPFVTDQREILQIVAKSKSPRNVIVREHEALPLMTLTAGAECTACEACFRACPTGAIQIRESETAWSLAFQGNQCVACEVCLEVCGPGALRPAAEVDVTPAKAEAILFTRNRQRCERCDRAFVSPTPATTCPVCADDEVAFDAIFG